MSKKTEAADIEHMKDIIKQIEALESEKIALINTLKKLTHKRYPSSTKPAFNVFKHNVNVCDVGMDGRLSEALDMLRDGKIVWDVEIIR